MNLIKSDCDNFIKITSEKYGIVYGTLKNKYNAYCKNKLTNINKENRGGVNKLISTNVERELYNIQCVPEIITLLQSHILK